MNYSNSKIFLEWVTNQENQDHAVKLGLKYRPIGGKNPTCILKEAEVIEIKLLQKNKTKLQQKQIAKLFNVKPYVIQKIFSNRSWKHLSV